MVGLGRAGGLALVAASLGCDGAVVRGETVLWIDTDLAVPASVDTLRIEVFSENGRERLDRRELTLATPDRWPVSLGLAATDENGAPSFRVRLTAYPARAAIDALGEAHSVAASAAAVCHEGAAAEGPAPIVDPAAIVEQPGPLPQFAVVRLVDIKVGAGEVSGARVTLRASCLAAMPGPVADPDARTCIDGDEGAPSAGVASESPDIAPQTAAGSSPLLAVTPCASPGVDGIDGRVCVPGGFGYLGDVREPPDQVDCPACNDLPPVPVRVKPFLLDRHEVTVGRFSDAIHDPDPSRRLVPPSQPVTPSPTTSRCTWPDDAATAPVVDPALRAMPLLCVTPELAMAFCAWAGGALPSEAAWYFAATGRGAALRYPWGDDEPTCDDVSYGRFESLCGLDGGPGPVDVFPRDTSIDGVVGLAGSAAEILADAPGALSRPGCRPSTTRGFGLLAYTGSTVDDAPCVCAGVVNDPPIESGETRLGMHVVRGSSWGDAQPRVRFRRYVAADQNSDLIGFRCAYADGGS